MFYLTISRSPREVCTQSEMFFADNLEQAQALAVESIFGCLSGDGFKFDPEDVLRRYNLDVVYMDDEWQMKFNFVYDGWMACADPSSV